MDESPIFFLTLSVALLFDETFLEWSGVLEFEVFEAPVLLVSEASSSDSLEDFDEG